MKYKGAALPARKTETLTLERGEDDPIILQVRGMTPEEESRGKRLFPVPARPMRFVMGPKGRALRDPDTNEVLLEPDGETPKKVRVAEARQQAFSIFCALSEDPHTEFEVNGEITLDGKPAEWADAIKAELDACLTEGEQQMVLTTSMRASGMFDAAKMIKEAQGVFK